MVLGPLALLSLIGVPFVLGAAVLRALGIVARTDRVAWAGWSWMVGSLAIGLILFVWLWTGPDMTTATVPVAVAIGLAAAAALLSRGRSLVPRSRAPPAPAWESWLFRLALAFVLVVTTERVLEGSLLAVVKGDEASFWAFRAKILFHEGGFGAGYAEGVRAYELAQADYPLLNPLLQLWAFIHAGRITHVVNRIPIQLFSVALVLVLSGGLRRATRPGFAAGLLLLLPAMHEALFGAKTAYSDVPVALGALVTLDCWLRWREDRHGGWIGLGSLALAFPLWCKYDGLLVLGGILGAACIWLIASRRARFGGRAGARLWWILPPAAVLALTWSVNAHFGAANLLLTSRVRATPSAPNPEGSFITLFFERFAERIGPILRYFGERIVLDPSQSQFVFIVFAILVVVGASARGLRSHLGLSAVALALAFSGAMLVFVGTPMKLDWHMETAATRVAFQFVPAILLWIGAASGKWMAEGPTMLSRYVAWPLAVFLVWRGVPTVKDSTLALARRATATAREAFTRTEDARIEAALAHDDRVRGGQTDLYGTVWREIREHVPEDALIYTFVPWERAWLAKTLRLLLYPRRFELAPPLRREVPDKLVQSYVGRGWVLDLVGLQTVFDGHFQRVAGGPEWSLWR